MNNHHFYYDHHYHHIGLKFEIRQTQQSISTATNSQHRSRSLEAFLDDCFIIDQNHVFWVSIYLLLGRSSYYQNQSFYPIIIIIKFPFIFLVHFCLLSFVRLLNKLFIFIKPCCECGCCQTYRWKYCRLPF